MLTIRNIYSLYYFIIFYYYIIKSNIIFLYYTPNIVYSDNYVIIQTSNIFENK